MLHFVILSKKFTSFDGINHVVITFIKYQNSEVFTNINCLQHVAETVKFFINCILIISILYTGIANLYVS